MLKSTLVLILSLGSAASHAETLGECAWGQVAPSDKQAILSGYQTSMDGGAAALELRDGPITAAVSTCAKRSDVPKQWVQLLISSQALQVSASNKLLLSKRVQRERLDKYYLETQEVSRQCVLANAASPEGLNKEPCSGSKAFLRFLESLNVSPTTDRTSAIQVALYMYAKVETETAEIAIAVLEHPPKPQ